MHVWKVGGVQSSALNSVTQVDSNNFRAEFRREVRVSAKTTTCIENQFALEKILSPQGLCEKFPLVSFVNALEFCPLKSEASSCFLKFRTNGSEFL